MMKTLIIDTDDSELHYQGGNLNVYSGGKKIRSVPVKPLERIIVSPQVTLTAGVLGVIAEHHVSLLVLNARLPERTATLVGHHSGDHQRRLEQYQHSLDKSLSLTIATRLVALKIQRQHAVLHQALGKRPELRRVLIAATKQLDSASATLATAAISDLGSLNGIEGAAARAYFQAYTQLFSQSLNFSGRNRRPPLDPVNAVLSLSYTLLHQEAVNALKMYGLDPALGFYHQICYGRDSLACDLIEPVRPFLDTWIWRLFADQTLAERHFTYDGAACFLNGAGKPIYYKQFYTEAKALKRLLRQYALALVKTLDEAGANG
jgi:CRISPR-associated protein Cas1